jgi:hypothetical protein
MSASENSASAPINLDQARGVVRAVAPVVIAEYESALAIFDLDERKIGCEAAIEYAADFLSKAYIGERPDPRSPQQIARSLMRHAMHKSLGLNQTNVVTLRPENKPTRHARRTKRPGSPTPFSWRMLKRREWLHANHYIRGFVSATIAPGGVGKSTNAIVEVLAMVTGLPLPHRTALRTTPGKRLRVWYVNGEDPIEETERRFQAAMLHFGIKPEDVEGRLFIDSGHDQDFVFARENGKVVTVVEPVVDSVMAGIKEKGIDCLVLDPVVSFHAVAENDNTKLQQVLEQFSAIANETKVSVELVAHTRKANGNEITADDARGASALHDKVRSLRSRGADLVAVPEIKRPAPDVIGVMDAQTPSSEAETPRRPVTLVVQAKRGARHPDRLPQCLGLTPDDGPTLLAGTAFWRFIGPGALPMHRVTIGGRAGAASH